MTMAAAVGLQRGDHGEDNNSDRQRRLRGEMGMLKLPFFVN
jgi:hypothetical protein